MLASRLRLASGDWGEMSLMRRRAKPRAPRAGCRRRSSFSANFCSSASPAGRSICERDQLVAALAVLAGEAAALEAQHLARLVPLGIVSITGPSGVGTFTLAPSTASLSVTGSVQADVVAVAA